MSSISEKCGCGAEFTVSTTYMTPAQEAAKDWRETHRHAESVGICGDTQSTGEGFPTLACDLKAGHAGMHHDSQNGAHWTPKPPKLCGPCYRGQHGCCDGNEYVRCECSHHAPTSTDCGDETDTTSQEARP